MELSWFVSPGDLRNRADMRCVFAIVTAVVSWDRERSEPQYQDRLLCDNWEVVVPELVFEPVSVSNGGTL